MRTAAPDRPPRKLAVTSKASGRELRHLSERNPAQTQLTANGAPHALMAID
jgi:hypothetical protein